MDIDEGHRCGAMGRASEEYKIRIAIPVEVAPHEAMAVEVAGGETGTGEARPSDRRGIVDRADFD